jgi:monomeric sarcosine oxidase
MESMPMKSEVPRKLKVGLKITGSSTLIFRLWFTSAGHEIGYTATLPNLDRRRLYNPSHLGRHARNSADTRTMIEDFDIAVVGLGAIGSAAAYHAAAKGAKVIGFEQFDLGHVHGASHDTSRIVRTSYHKSEYVALAKSAYKDWRALEKATDTHLLDITGGVVFLSKNGDMTPEEYTSSLDANQVPYELLSPKQVSQRWPQFQPPEGIETIYCADTGIVHASRSVAAMQYLARTNGAVLKARSPVESVKPERGGGVTVTTPKGSYRVQKVILAADAWTNKLLAPLRSGIPLKVSQEQITYFKPSDPSAYEPQNFPVWMWGADHHYYGFPCYGEPTIKAGRHCGENWMTPEERTYVPSDYLFQQLVEQLDKFMPDAGRKPLRTITCQYSLTPEHYFVLSPLEKYKDIIVGLGSGHAFKFAPTLGRVLAELAIDGTTEEDIASFGIPKAVAEQLASKL